MVHQIPADCLACRLTVRDDLPPRERSLSAVATSHRGQYAVQHASMQCCACGDACAASIQRRETRRTAWDSRFNSCARSKMASSSGVMFHPFGVGTGPCQRTRLHPGAHKRTGSRRRARLHLTRFRCAGARRRFRFVWAQEPRPPLACRFRHCASSWLWRGPLSAPRFRAKPRAPARVLHDARQYTMQAAHTRRADRASAAACARHSARQRASTPRQATAPGCRRAQHHLVYPAQSRSYAVPQFEAVEIRLLRRCAAAGKPRRPAEENTFPPIHDWIRGGFCVRRHVRQWTVTDCGSCCQKKLTQRMATVLARAILLVALVPLAEGFLAGSPRLPRAAAGAPGTPLRRQSGVAAFAGARRAGRRAAVLSVAASSAGGDGILIVGGGPR